MTNLVSRRGERYLCFIVTKVGRGWSGPYGQTWSGSVWECVECGYQLREHLSNWDKHRMSEHHGCGHAPCPRCGKPLLLRKDGTPREHSWRLCPGKAAGHHIEREYRKNITTHELGRTTTGHDLIGAT